MKKQISKGSRLSSGAADIVTTQISDTRTLTHIPTSDDYEKVDLQDKQAL